LLLAQGYVFGPNVRVNNDPPGINHHNTLNWAGQHLIAARGDTVYVVWEDDRTSAFHQYFARSTNAGQSFEPNIRLDRDGETSGAPSIAVDNSGGIHVVWQRGIVRYVKSTDGGQTFSIPVQASENAGLEPSIAVSRDGRRIYIAHPVGPGLDTDIMLSRSTDGGQTFMLPETRVNDDTTTGMNYPAVALFQDTIVLVAWNDATSSQNARDVFVARSADGGASFGTSILLNDTAGSSTSQYAVSAGADSLGRVYVVWVGIGGDYGLGISVSTDTGRTFLHEREVPGTPGGDFPSLWVSRSGELYLAWEFWNGDRDGRYHEVRFSCSADGGTTFSTPVNPSDGPDDDEECSVSVAANAEGKVFIAWDDNRHCLQGFYNDVYLATGTMSAIGEQPKPQATKRGCRILPNPAAGPVQIEYSTGAVGFSEVRIVDCTGRLVATLGSGAKPAGQQVVTWNGCDDKGGCLVPGVYFVRIDSPDGTVTARVQLIRE
jgi:hypothetical protein